MGIILIEFEDVKFDMSRRMIDKMDELIEKYSSSGYWEDRDEFVTSAIRNYFMKYNPIEKIRL